MLLIGNHKTEIFKRKPLLNQGMGADQNVNFMTGRRRIDPPLFSGLHGADEQAAADVDSCILTEFFKITDKAFVMLPRQHLRRRHQTPLISGLNAGQKGQLGEHRLSGSHIPLKQPVHGMISGKISGNIFPRPHLSPCQCVAESLYKSPSPCQ